MTTPRFSVLPSVERILSAEDTQPCLALWGHQAVKLAVTHLQGEIRRTGNVPDWAESSAGYAHHVKDYLLKKYGQGMRRVFNLTGTLVHTNLGRARLSRRMIDAGLAVAVHAVTLEYDLDTGTRGDRDRLVEELLCAMTGAEAATVVNNNAAAVLLVLNTLALNRSVPVSRGELIEIGGSFRLPDIMTRAGCHLREVGTTNRTHLSDYQSAIDPDTSLLLKIHPSNYHIEGFTKDVRVPELAKLARAEHLPLCVDLGSGALLDLSHYGLPKEPTVREVLSQGADLVTFSGDKLLGSIQAGIVVGRKKWVEALKHNPLKRALRCDKITLGILSETLRIYQEPERLTDQIPLLQMMTCPLEWLSEKAEEIRSVLVKALGPGCRVLIQPSHCQIGSGTLPNKTIDSVALCITAESDSESTVLLQRLRRLPIPVIGRMADGSVWLDLRSLAAGDDAAELIQNLATLSA